ncbi:uncharacterized protein CG3556 [Hylaeus anthracinus]|uniref:uncharacterized protein CG3556 n=1 Tax=Hylaeus anthracinus TaxID=313031 RepID=UPI0023B9DAD0|nr:uncharacterized protein CG3556 [Hylaeus anthracinus]XP_053998857.1 uncharacterized protein CG3556 [Hylaeus anthracinus]XP_053998858.1 uncharacterized protein CG3556 [Hylaeus anthracinus]XP_053998859.1 uncharacterized protein CG3556 [Hylaeus anthracinus]XP_053998860.1 uncharacterized protein CG3556 [Hylaeus anthracinus]XP_053998861.1 uncharacterized protein CG3556 [Hylaeus anthracinus]XP_053998862.1 uncharacterized protein CG3556 [Hylaeus anthracinus]
MCIVRSSVKMWGRASMAAVMILLLLCSWTLGVVHGEGNLTEVGSTDTEAEGILERATVWLWSQRDKDAGWGNDTHRVLLVLRLANLSREDNVAPPAPFELQLSSKQMELEIVLLLWRHREIGFSPVRLARYTLALNAMCTDPRQFHGHDLIGTLQHHEPPTDYEFALTTLAACNAQGHVRRRQIRRLMDIANDAQDHNVDTVAMVILALKCIVQDHKHRNLHHFLRKPSIGLAQQQRLDGSFGDLRTTALVMQALEEAENEPADSWNRSAALVWLSSQQRPDGSFGGDIRATAEAVLGVTPRSLASIRILDCGQGLSDTSPPRLTIATTTTSTSNGNGNESTITSNHNEAVSSVSGNNASNESVSSDASNGNNGINGNRGNSVGNAVNSSNTDNGVVVGTTAPVIVNVSYTLWVGSHVNETYNLTVNAPKNERFYEVMLLAAEMSPHFQFVASEWPNGHYVHTIAGYKEEPMSYHYWLLYRLPLPPDPSSPPGNQLVAPGGVDDLQINEGDHYLFWYKKL